MKNIRYKLIDVHLYEAASKTAKAVLKACTSSIKTNSTEKPLKPQPL